MLTSKTQIWDFISSAFQNPFNVRNSCLSTPSSVPQRISQSIRETEENFLSEFKVFLIINIYSKQAKIFKRIPKLWFVSCEGIYVSLS